MKIGHFDAFSGISGDMTIGALLDAGAAFDALREGLESLATGAQFRAERVKRRGIAATKFHVDYEEQRKHRHLPHILRMIDGSGLPLRVKERASTAFEVLADAEASVHGVARERVHFHEVGAVDSICDIVGAFLALDLLGVESVTCSPVNLGSGTVETEHGTLPVPAPATARIIAGKPSYAAGPAMELTTPTGAVIACTMASAFGPMPPMRIATTGYGAGSKDFPSQANVLRFTLGEAIAADESTTVTVVEANIDDCSPQVLGYTMDRLFAAGALDVTLQPLLMKKNRQGTLLTVLTTPDREPELTAIVFAETSTLGVRLYQAQRRVQPREFRTVSTPHGDVRIKISAEGRFAPEYDDCRAIAERTGLPLRQILAEAQESFSRNQ